MTKHQPLYREVLKKSFLISWKNKWLWFYGFFASALASGLAYEVFWKSFSSAGAAGWDVGLYLPPVFGKVNFLESFKIWGMPWSIILVGLVVITLCLVLVFVAVVSYGALINGARKATRGKSSFRDSWNAGFKNFWHILGYNAGGKILTYALVFLAALPLGWYLKSGGTSAFILYFLIFIITVAASLVISFLCVFASAGRVILGENFLESVKNALLTFKNHWLVSIEMTAILFAINIAGALLLATVMIFVSVPFFLLFLGAYLLNSGFAFWTVLILALLVYGLLTVLAGSFLCAWNISSWTVLYLRIVENTAVSKLVRLSKHLQSYFKFK